MNPTLASAESSAVIATLRESKQVNRFVYSEANALHVNHSLQISNVPISSGTCAASKTFTFQIPKNGLLGQLWLNLQMPAFARANGDNQDITTGEQAGGPTTANVEGFTRLGLLNCIETIKLESSGRVLESLSKWQILQRLSDLPPGERAAAQAAYRMGTDAISGRSYRTDLLLPFFWYKDTAKYGLDSDFVEAHRVVVTLSDCACIYKSGDDAGVKIHEPTDAELMCEFRQIDDSTRQEIISKNYGSGMLSKVVRMSREEAYTVDTPTTTDPRTVTVDLKESDCITGLYIVVECPNPHPNAYNSYPRALAAGAPTQILEAELKFAGQTVMKVPGYWLQHYGRTFGRHGSHEGDGSEDRYTDASLMKYVYKINFGAVGTELSNVVALREISRATLTLTYLPVEAQQHNIHIGYDSVSFMTTSASTGRTNLSISS